MFVRSLMVVVFKLCDGVVCLGYSLQYV